MKEDWIDVEIGEVANIYNGNSINAQVKEKKYKNLKDGYNYIGTKDVGFDAVVDYENGVKIPFKENSFKIAPAGCVLVCSEGGSAGRKTAYIEQDICFGNKLYAITDEYNVLEGKYVFYYSRFRKFFEDFKNQMNGIFGGVSTNKFSEITFPLAPLPVQRAIVSKTEELFSDLDNGVANFKKAQEQLKTYRQAVLKKAFEGELSKEWREKQTNLPTAEELLKQIKEERQNHYDQQIEDWKKTVKEWEKNGKKESKPSNPQNLVSYPEIEQNEYLPILNLGELVSQISIKLMPDDAPNMPFIGMDCLEKNALKPHFTYKFNEFKSAGNWFNVNHILYGRMRPYLNKVYHAEYEGVASGEFIILETTESILPQYLKLILHQQDFVHWSNRQSSGDKPRVKFEQIALYNITVPTVQEQTHIVQEIESRLSVCDKMEQSINESIEKADALRQSILKKAFEGKLLSKSEIELCKTAADSEPASELLKKIKAEKLEDLPKLPVGWAWITFAQLCSLQRGYDLPLKNIIEGKYPVITSGGIGGFHNEYKTIGPALITGRSGGVGNIHYLDVDYYWPHNTVLHVKDFHNNYPKYVYYYFTQFDFKSYSASTAVPTLDRKNLFKIPVRICTFQEQTHIVQEIESRLSVCDKMEQSINESIEKAEALRQSILKKAFEGKLLSKSEIELCKTAADYEPASELLKKIKAEKLAKGEALRQSSGKKKTTSKKKSKK